MVVRAARRTSELTDVLWPFFVPGWQATLEWDVVGIGDPTDVVGVFNVRT